MTSTVRRKGRRPSARDGRPVPGGTARAPGTRAVTGPPSVASAVATLVGVALFLVGGTWDVSWHVAAGRESFWSPPHFVLYAGILVMLMTAVHGLAFAWRRRVVPAPGAAIGATGAGVALASAPLDDFWHRVYGLDVTIWSAPHLLLIGGVALAAFGAVVTGARAHRHPTLPAPWLPFEAPWSVATGVVLVGTGLMVDVASGTVAEFDFDVARFAVAWHPPILAGIVAFGLGLAGRVSRRAGGALLAGAAFTLARVATDWIQRGLAMPRPDIPLVLVLSFAFEAVVVLARLRWPGRTPGAAVAAVAGAAGAIALLLAQWPYTTALGGAVWSPAVLARAAGPAIAIAAGAAAAGWVVGRRIGDLAVGGSPVAAPDPGRSRWSEVMLVAATIGLAGSGIAPAIASFGAPREAWGAAPREGLASSPPVVGQVEVVPPAPVVGQPVTVRLVLTDSTLLQTVGRASAIPFESPRAGDVVEGAMRALGPPGAYEATFTPREAGRRWFSVYLPGEFGRVAVTAGFTTYLPGQVGRATQAATRGAVLRPEPGPDDSRPDWLEPVAIGGIAAILGAATLVTAWSIRRAP